MGLQGSKIAWAKKLKLGRLIHGSRLVVKICSEVEGEDMLNFRVENKVAVIALDDGKANAVSHDYVEAMNEGLDRAEQEASAVVLTGRAGVFSAGFDLKELAKGPAEQSALVNKGAQMLLRLFTHPQPVVAASAGHAIAAGALVLLASDTRIGAAGDFKYGLNETAIGMSLPPFGLQLAFCRLSKRHQTQAIIQANLYAPEDAQTVGFLDQVVAADLVEETAMGQAAALGELPAKAYAGMKFDSRAEYIQIIKASLA
jgi:enoyl-CoA hydratase